MTYLLAGDVGGTKTDLAIYSEERGASTPVQEATFASGRYSSLEALVREFLDRVHLPVDRATFGVAGPVIDGTVEITNLPWKMDEQRLAGELRIRSVRLLNDLVATAHAVPFLGAADLHTLNPGTPMFGGAIGVVAPGTGLGEAFLTWDGARYHVHASEGGHTDFAPTNQLQMELLVRLLLEEAHVSYERVCSGIGIPSLYAFLKARPNADEPAWLAQEIAAAPTPTPIIVRAAAETPPPNDLRMATLELFVDILGAEAGNLALKLLATGGIYIGGGIPPRILPVLDRGGFKRAFQEKGRFSDILSDVPLHVIMKPQVALFGAACHALEPVPD